ncbi:DUF3833 domain-containing protein [Pseudomonas sp. BIGb0427]|uniref:DUF3833 domain-containing protein n=1 Tax=unclassified Pseudomonas TaxID=196821 RepID=UPI0018A6EE82|nr:MULTISPECIES: DUF3833 domain-containing protein [unclassified Pseudomonas]QPG61895.1 DUF3833 domain-containing protein [Pseudomonas sp. BIGb0427]UVM69375.1 DUF3833 domain-containing protein [Pseudomonas sp. B21-009]
MYKVLLLIGCLLLGSCGNVGVERYAGEHPRLNLVEFFSRPVQAWGMFQKRSGEVVKRFHVRIDSRREGERLILDEHFLYSDGTRQQRTWTLTPDGPNRWRGTAGDVIGEAIGEVAGNTLRWRYRLDLPVDGRNWEVDLDDWMYLMDDDTLLNRSSMSKLGVEIGQITLFFRRLPEGTP